MKRKPNPIPEIEDVPGDVTPADIPDPIPPQAAIPPAEVLQLMSAFAGDRNPNLTEEEKTRAARLIEDTVRRFEALGFPPPTMAENPDHCVFAYCRHAAAALGSALDSDATYQNAREVVFFCCCQQFGRVMEQRRQEEKLGMLSSLLGSAPPSECNCPECTAERGARPNGNHEPRKIGFRA